MIQHGADFTLIYQVNSDSQYQTSEVSEISEVFIKNSREFAEVLCKAI